MIKRLAVFCGAKPGEDPDYMKMAQSFGEEMAKNDIDLVYGGANLVSWAAVPMPLLIMAAKYTA